MLLTAIIGPVPTTQTATFGCMIGPSLDGPRRNSFGVHLPHVARAHSIQCRQIFPSLATALNAAS